MMMSKPHYSVSKVYDFAASAGGGGARALLGQAAAALAEGQCEIVREMPSRVAARLTLGGKRYFVKAFRIVGAYGRFLAALGAGRAVRELKAAQRLKNLGIPTAEPIAGGLVDGPEGRRELAIFRELVDAASVHSIALEQFALSDGRARRAIIRRYLGPFAEFVARSVAAGVRHGDFHGGNILVSGEPPRFYLVDLQAARFGRPRDAAGRAARALGQLDFLFSMVASRSERMAFAREVLARLGGPVELSTFVRMADGSSRKHRRRLFARRGAKCVSGARRFIRKSSRTWRIWAKRDWFQRAAIKLPDWFERIVPEGKVLKAGHTTTVFKLPPEADGLPALVVKRYNNTGLAYVLKHLYRRCRALRAWRLANELAVRRIATACPVAAAEFRRGPVLDRSFFVTRKVEGKTLPEYLGQQRQEGGGLEANRRLARRLGRLVRRMHDAGFDHRDLKPSNVLVVAGRAGSAPVLVDMDGIRRRRMSVRRRAKNLARLLRGPLGAEGAGNWSESEFLAGYTGPFDEGCRKLHRLVQLIEEYNKPVQQDHREKPGP